MAVALAVVGLYFLCITDGFSLGKGDIYIFLCAVVYTMHILVIDHFAPKTDNVKCPVSSYGSRCAVGTIYADTGNRDF